MDGLMAIADADDDCWSAKAKVVKTTKILKGKVPNNKILILYSLIGYTILMFY